MYVTVKILETNVFSDHENTKELDEESNLLRRRSLRKYF